MNSTDMDWGQQNVIDGNSGKYPKYFKSVKHLENIDVYMTHRLFNVNDPALHHASKKILMAGERTGEKSMVDDIREARDTLNRWLEMECEE